MRLWDALANLRPLREAISIQDRDLIEVVAQDAGRQQPGHASADDDGVFACLAVNGVRLVGHVFAPTTVKPAQYRMLPIRAAGRNGRTARPDAARATAGDGHTTRRSGSGAPARPPRARTRAARLHPYGRPLCWPGQKWACARRCGF